MNNKLDKLYGAEIYKLYERQNLIRIIVSVFIFIVLSIGLYFLYEYSYIKDIGWVAVVSILGLIIATPIALRFMLHSIFRVKIDENPEFKKKFTFLPFIVGFSIFFYISIDVHKRDSKELENYGVYTTGVLRFSNSNYDFYTDRGADFFCADFMVNGIKYTTSTIGDEEHKFISGAKVQVVYSKRNPKINEISENSY